MDFIDYPPCLRPLGRLYTPPSLAPPLDREEINGIIQAKKRILTSSSH